jgi:hypothetical protein
MEGVRRPVREAKGGVLVDQLGTCEVGDWVEARAWGNDPPILLQFDGWKPCGKDTTACGHVRGRSVIGQRLDLHVSRAPKPAPLSVVFAALNEVKRP